MVRHMLHCLQQQQGDGAAAGCSWAEKRYDGSLAALLLELWARSRGAAQGTSRTCFSQQLLLMPRLSPPSSHVTLLLLQQLLSVKPTGTAVCHSSCAAQCHVPPVVLVILCCCVAISCCCVQCGCGVV